MKWRVTYRGKDGQQVEDLFEAGSRGELFKVLSAKGISAVRVAEDDGKRRAVRKRQAGNSGVWIAALAGLAVIAGGILYFLGGDEKESPTPERPVRQTKVPPPVTNAVETAAAEVKPQEPAKPEPQPYVKRPGQMQLPNGKILTFPPPKEGEIRKVYANGRMYECDHLGNFKDVTKRKLFKTAFELNFLAFAQEGKPYIPVFLKGLDQEEVKKILLKDYNQIGDETEEEWAELKAYDNMRLAALEYMEQGGKFDDFVDEYAKFDRSQRETRAMGLREIMTLYKEGKVEEAKQMAEAANLLMEKKGFKPVQLPPHVQEAFDSIH